MSLLTLQGGSEFFLISLCPVRTVQRAKGNGKKESGYTSPAAGKTSLGG